MARANCSADEHTGAARAEVPVESGAICEHESRPARQTGRQPADSGGPQRAAHDAESKSRRAAGRTSIRLRRSRELLQGRSLRDSGCQTLEARGPAIALAGNLKSPMLAEAGVRSLRRKNPDRHQVAHPARRAPPGDHAADQQTRPDGVFGRAALIFLPQCSIGDSLPPHAPDSIRFRRGVR